MSAIAIELPRREREFVDAKVADGKYTSASDFLTTLVTDALRREAAEHLAALLKEGEESGPSVVMTPDEWTHLWKEADEEFARQASS